MDADKVQRDSYHEEANTNESPGGNEISHWTADLSYCSEVYTSNYHFDSGFQSSKMLTSKTQVDSIVILVLLKIISPLLV